MSRSSSLNAAWPDTRSNNSSSEIWLLASLGSMPNARKTMSVDFDSSQINGRKMLATTLMIPAVAKAISSALNRATLFGTNSPKTKEK